MKICLQRSMQVKKIILCVRQMCVRCCAWPSSCWMAIIMSSKIWKKLWKFAAKKKMMESEQWMIRWVQPYVTTTAERVKEIAFKKKTATKTLLQCHSPARIHAMDESKSEIRFLSDSAVCSLLRQYLVWLLQRVTRRSGFIHSLRSRDFIIST